MKLKVLLVFVAIIAMSVTTASAGVETSLREIILRSKNPVRPRLAVTGMSMVTAELAPMVETYVFGNTVTVDFDAPVNEASIIVTSNETGEVIYYDVFSSQKASTLEINLNGCYDGEYSIDIDTKNNFYSKDLVIRSSLFR